MKEVRERETWRERKEGNYESEVNREGVRQGREWERERERDLARECMSVVER